MDGKTADGNAAPPVHEDKIFVSYARADLDTVADLVSRLERAGCRIWWDRNLRSGQAYVLVIDDEIAAASAVLVFWSANARRSVWVHGEASAGLDAGKLVQVTLDAARPPVPFNAIHLVDLSQWPQGGDALVSALVDAIRSQEDAPYGQVTVVPARAAVSQSGWAIAVLAATAPAIAAAALFGVQTETLGADAFSALAVTSFVASAAALVAAVRTWVWLDTREPAGLMPEEAER